MATVTEKAFPSEPVVIEQHLLLHDVSWQEYVAIGEALTERPALRLTYDRGNLEIRKTSSPPAPTAWTSDPQRLVLWDVTWSEYEKLLQALDRQHLRITYDKGSLELMTLSPEHERYKQGLRLLIQVLAEELQIALANLGSTTYRREDLEKGLESDECYYIKNWPLVRGKKRLDMTVDPPPDLALEVDVTHSSVKRLAIYALLGVPEVWRFDGTTLQVLVLGTDGQYTESPHSPTFPLVPLADLARRVREGVTLDDTTVLRSFRTWVREELAKNA